MTNIDINLDMRFYISYDATSKSLNINKNENYLENYWGSNISSLNTIAGGNGVGKTSVLKLITDRFRRGLNHPENTLLILKTDNQYEIFYDEGLFKNENVIVINGSVYNIEHSLLNKNLNTTYIKIDNLDITLAVRKISKKEKKNQKDLIDIQINTRIGENNSLVFYTNNWNYSRLDRNIDQEIRTRSLDYFDFSMGNRIDTIIRKYYEYEPRIADPSTIYDIEEDSRFEIDYLFKLQEEDMVRTLTYLDKSSNFNLLNNYFNIPEEIYIHFDFMDSKKRGAIFQKEEAYLRFEKRNKNYSLENAIYDYLLRNEIREVEVKEALALSIIEKLFTDIDILVSATDLKKSIAELDSREQYELTKDTDILTMVVKYKKLVSNAIKKQTLGKVFTKNVQKDLLHRVGELINSYKDFLEYIFTDFIVQVDKRKINTTMFVHEESTITTKFIEIEIPIIKMDKAGISLARTFFGKYSKLKSKNKSLYFAWRNLSAGESQLLTLLTSLNTAIQEATHNDIIILLDEVEISLHPMWQKNLIKLLVENLNAKAKMEQKNIQIIIATHSPFILSDLPFNSLILLKKDEKDKITVQNELEGQVATLGANIHELYSHSFFLKDGLIGDYAKQKINAVANTLIKYKSDQNTSINWEEIKKIINQIGEPIIKARLVELYNQKYKLNKPLEMEKIKGEIENLKERLKQLEKKDD